MSEALAARAPCGRPAARHVRSRPARAQAAAPARIPFPPRPKRRNAEMRDASGKCGGAPPRPSRPLRRAPRCAIRPRRSLRNPESRRSRNTRRFRCRRAMPISAPPGAPEPPPASATAPAWPKARHEPAFDELPWRSAAAATAAPAAGADELFRLHVAGRTQAGSEAPPVAEQARPEPQPPS